VLADTAFFLGLTATMDGAAANAGFAAYGALS
jgi:hypothetical protein